MGPTPGPRPSGKAPDRAVLVSVIGAGQCDQPTDAIAFKVGALLAEAGLGVVCGGLDGVMAAAARGAAARGGLTVGIIPGPDPNDANPYLSIVIPTQMGHARNVLVVRAGQAAIAIGGAYGTLSEIALALKMGKPVISLNSWRPGEEVIPAATAEEAVAAVLALIRRGGGGGDERR